MNTASPEEEQSLPHPTIPEKLAVTLKGFPDDASTHAFADVIGDIVSIISRWINLELLDGITVAYDYDEALVSLDRGFQSTMPLQSTSGGEIIGVAMTPAVLRDGALKAHMVFHAGVMLPLKNEDQSPEFLQSLYLVAHECAHVEDWMNWDQAFPNILLRAESNDVEDFIVGGEAQSLWREYAACRISARFGPEQTATLEENLISVLNVATNQCNEAIRSYRHHSNTYRVLVEAGGSLCKPLRMTAYLLGHLDGLGQELENVPATKDLLIASRYGKFVAQLQTVLRGLWSQRGRWQSLQAFDPLRDVVKALLADGGMILSRLENGQLYVDIPFTPETLP